MDFKDQIKQLASRVEKIIYSEIFLKFSLVEKNIRQY